MPSVSSKKLYGLVGKAISYSFSRQYFSHRFKELGLDDYHYVNFDIPSIEAWSSVLNRQPSGLNITIPYKQSVIPYLNKLSEEAAAVGAVNTIHFNTQRKSTGYNTDIYGFKKALMEFLDDKPNAALVLGNGGAAKAVNFVLRQCSIPSQIVSRTPNINRSNKGYEALNEDTMQQHQLIINTTPVGTFPKVNEAPTIPYQFLTKKHYLFDLIYNPQESLFLKLGKTRGAKTCNGYRMLIYQAEKSWEIWSSTPAKLPLLS